MRKLGLTSLFAVLALAFSGCVIVGPSVSSFKFDSNWQLNSTGAFVLCSNRESRLRYSFVVDGSVTSITETYTGLASGNTVTVNRPLTDLTKTNTTFTFEGIANFGSGGIPQSVYKGVSQQAISITPIAPPTSQNGETTLTVAVTADGTTYQSSYKYKTFANCP